MAGKILIVEDDRAIAQSLIRLLSREDYYVSVAGSAEEASAQIALDPTYDLALLDVALPGNDGFWCCSHFRDQGLRIPVIMLTGRTGSGDKVRGLEAGADDYVVKPFEPNELIARIRAQLRRSRDYNSTTESLDRIDIGPDLVVDLRNRDALVNDNKAHLTDREFELLLLMARNPNAALNKVWLFQQIWGCAPEMGLKALAVYVHRLRQKVEADENNPRYIQTVRGYGYKLVMATDDPA